MSYGISMNDENGDTIHYDSAHHIAGGTYALGGTTEAWLNITWNYGGFYREQFGPNGIREIYGKSGLEAKPLLEKAIAALGTEQTSNYWDATPGNAGAALVGLLQFAKDFPNGIFDGD